ncbi:MAG: hypothetical protein ACI8S6_005006 [Myxococcota bacterium]|jgi:hypothetical protein
MSNALTARHAALKPLALNDLVVGHQSDELFSSFYAADGAIVDLAGLDAIAAAPDQAVFTALSAISPTDNNLVLDRMTVAGRTLSWNGELPDGDGTRKVPIYARGLMQLAADVMVSEGLAVVADRLGRRHVVRFTEPTPAENAPLSEPCALVLSVETVRDDLAAREKVIPHVRFVPIAEARAPHHLVLAMTVRTGIWASDVQRLVPPDHPIIEGILDLLTHLEHVVWTEDRHGWPWDRRQQGREWSRYQTTATLALQATRTALMTHASTTIDRVRLLRNLHFQLRRSIEKAEQAMFEWMGVTEAPDPYRAVAPIDAALAVPASRRLGGLAQEFQQVFSTYALRDQRKDANRAYAQVFIYPPVNRTGYNTLCADFGALRDFVETQHQANPDLLAASDVEFIIRDGGTKTLDDPEGIVDALVAQSGWQPL